MASRIQDNLPAFVKDAMNGFGKRVESVRLQRGISQRGISKLTDKAISPTGVYHIECGTRWPSVATLLVLANAYDCDFKLTRKGEIKIYGTGLNMEEDS